MLVAWFIVAMHVTKLSVVWAGKSFLLVEAVIAILVFILVIVLFIYLWFLG